MISYFNLIYKGLYDETIFEKYYKNILKICNSKGIIRNSDIKYLKQNISIFSILTFDVDLKRRLHPYISRL